MGLRANTQAANAAHACNNVRAQPRANLRLLGVLLNLALLTGSRTTEALNIAWSPIISAAATDDAYATSVSDHARMSGASATEKATLLVEAGPNRAEVPSATEPAAALQNLSPTWAAVQSTAAEDAISSTEAAAFDYPDPFFLGGGTAEDLLDWVRTNGGEVNCHTDPDTFQADNAPAYLHMVVLQIGLPVQSLHVTWQPAMTRLDINGVKGCTNRC